MVAHHQSIMGPSHAGQTRRPEWPTRRSEGPAFDACSATGWAYANLHHVLSNYAPDPPDASSCDAKPARKPARSAIGDGSGGGGGDESGKHKQAVQEARARLAAAVDGGGSSGTLFHARRVREYKGVRLFDGPAVMPPPPLRGAATGAVDASGARNCTNWAVCTTINEPTDAVRVLAQLPHWCLVVVGDQKSPPSYALGNSSTRRAGSIVYLTPADQVYPPI